MLDFSWSELLVVLVVAVIVIGPKQIPDILYHVGRFTRRIQYMRFLRSANNLMTSWNKRK